MDDYDFNKQVLKPQSNFTEVPFRPKEKIKTGCTTSRSRQKQVITSFSKKSIHSPNSKHIKSSNSSQRPDASNKVLQSIKKSNCQSEYYVKQAQTNDAFANVRIEDEIRIKDENIKLLSDRLAQSQSLVRQLTTENKLKTEKIAKLEEQMNSLLTKSLKHLEIETIGVNLSYECEKYKQDQRRLLKMLEQTAEYEYFSKFALMDNGVEFLRIHNQNKKTTIDTALASKKLVHFCNCSKEFISQSNFWVPEKVYSFGKQFVQQRKGNLTISEFELLLYELNRIWREREKKIINTLKGETTRQVQKYKRKMNSISAERKQLSK